MIEGSWGQFAANAVHGVPRITMLPSLSGAYSSGEYPWTDAQVQKSRLQ